MKKIIIFLLLAWPMSVFGAGEWCGTTNYSGIPGLGQTDTVKVLVIWGVGSGSPHTRLFSWYKTIFDINSSSSIPRFFKDNSKDKHVIVADVYGRYGLNDTLPVVSDSAYGSFDCYSNHGGCHFAVDVFKKLDDSDNREIFAPVSKTPFQGCRITRF